MNLTDLLRSINDSGDVFDPPKDERVSQYQQVFGDELANTSVDEFTLKGWQYFGDQYFSQIRDRIAHANPEYAETWNSVQIITVNTQEERTSVHSSYDTDVIVVDSLMMLFLWTMNKAHLYGKRLAGGEQLKLICELLLHFGTLRHFGSEGPIWPRPKTPPHESIAEFQSLFILTNTQELFMVAHEMAHLVCDKQPDITADFICRGEYETPYTMMFERDSKIDDELLADELSVELVLKTFSRTPAVEQVVLSSIFLLIRYRLWLALASKSPESDYEFRLWFARNSLFRSKASSCYSDGAAIFLIELLEELEQTLEPAAMQAEKVFKLIIESQRGS